MSRHTPDLDSLIDGHVLGPKRDRFARVHDVLVRAGPLPALPDTLARPPHMRRTATGRRQPAR
jgi:hypothetical protein